MSFFKVPTELVKAADEQTTGFSGLKSAIYTAKILAAYIVDSGTSDAKALTLQYQVDGNERIFYESLWYQEGRGLNTYANKKTGKETLLPSFTQMLDFFEAAGVDVNSIAPEPLLVNHFGTEGTYPVFKELSGKVMKLGIRHLLKDDYKDSTQVDDTQTIQLYVNDEGKSGGQLRGASNAYTVESWEKVIAKKPDLDQRKDSKSGASTSAGSEATTTVKASW